MQCKNTRGTYCIENRTNLKHKLITEIKFIIKETFAPGFKTIYLQTPSRFADNDCFHNPKLLTSNFYSKVTFLDLINKYLDYILNLELGKKITFLCWSRRIK